MTSCRGGRRGPWVAALGGGPRHAVPRCCWGGVAPPEPGPAAPSCMDKAKPAATLTQQATAVTARSWHCVCDVFLQLQCWGQQCPARGGRGSVPRRVRAGVFSGSESAGPGAVGRPHAAPDRAPRASGRVRTVPATRAPSRSRCRA